jgi:hypothetical protein
MTIRLFALLAVVALVPGCGILEPKVTSPISGKEVTSGQLAAEIAKADAAELQAQRNDERKATLEQRASQREASAAFAALNAERDQFEAKYRARADEITREAQVKLDASVDWFTNATLAREEQRKALASQFDLAAEQLKAKAEAAQGIFAALKGIPVVGQAIASSGAGGAIEAIFGTLVGGTGMAFLARRAKKREDEAWDESERKAKEAASQQQALTLALLGRFDANKDGKLDADELAKARGEAGVVA